MANEPEPARSAEEPEDDLGEKQQSGFWAALRSLLKNVATAASALSAIVIVALLGLAGFEAIFERAITVQPLAVPKSLSENGFSGEVAATRLVDEVNGLKEKAKSNIQMLDVAGRDATPEFVIPTLGLSVQALAAEIGKYLSNEQRQIVSGEFTIAGNMLFLRIRLNGRQILSTSQGVDPHDPDKLLETAARALLKKTQPYVLASAEYTESDDTLEAKAKTTRREEALATLNDLLASHPASDGQVKYAHLLRGTIFLDEKRYADAEAEYKKALTIDPDFAAAKIDLGQVYADEDKDQDALRQYTEALEIKPNSALAHAKRAVVRTKLGQIDDAIVDYKAALLADPSSALAHEKLGELLVMKKACNTALEQFEAAAALDPKNDLAKKNAEVVRAALGRGGQGGSEVGATTAPAGAGPAKQAASPGAVGCAD